jgi:hypothetical protein
MGGTCCLSNSGVYKMLAPTYQTVTQCHIPEERIQTFYCHSKAKPYIYKLKYMRQILGYLSLFVKTQDSWNVLTQNLDLSQKYIK